MARESAAKGMEMTSEEIRSWLHFSRLELSAKKAGMLLDQFGDAASVLRASSKELLGIEGLGEKFVDRLLAPEPAAVEEDLAVVEELGITILTIRDSDYPAGLREIFDPPPVLYVRGAIRESDKFAVSVVGSRRASVYGKSMSSRISSVLARRGLTIVSGGARGIDTAAHQGALDAGGRTICVLGCGVDVAYPPENKALFNRIAENGAVVSEFPLRTIPEPWRFPIRNRIISGMSLGVLVCQAPIDSGALITARYAGDQGKDVYALPGNVDDVRNSGSHKLIRDGAVLVESAQDILDELGVPAAEAQKPKLSSAFSGLSPDERRIVDMLSLEPKHVDLIIQDMQLPAPEVSSMLTLLEMKGLIRRVPGSAYVRAL